MMGRDSSYSSHPLRKADLITDLGAPHSAAPHPTALIHASLAEGDWLPSQAYLHILLFPLVFKSFSPSVKNRPVGAHKYLSNVDLMYSWSLSLKKQHHLMFHSF